MDPISQPKAPFRDARQALSFALNHSTDSIARPSMTRILEEAASSLKDPDTVKSRSTSPGQGPSKSGQDGAFLAGVVLRYFAKLSAPQRLCLLARSLTPRLHCSCGSQCCAGWRLSADWDAAVEGICFVLKEHAEVSRVPGRKGMSTPPVLRRSLVERMFAASGHFDKSLSAIAQSVGVTEVTVYAHKSLITEYLEEVEVSGWHALSVSLADAAIVGHQG